VQSGSQVVRKREKLYLEKGGEKKSAEKSMAQTSSLWISRGGGKGVTTRRGKRFPRRGWDTERCQVSYRRGASKKNAEKVKKKGTRKEEKIQLLLKRQQKIRRGGS